MTEVPKRLYYPVDYNSPYDRQREIYEQKKHLEQERLQKRLRQYQLQEEQYEQDARAIEGKGRR